VETTIPDNQSPRPLQWVVVQLSSWAKDKLTQGELAGVVHKKLPGLEVFYPIKEDTYGRQDSPYSEYLFIEYLPNMDYRLLESLEEFTGLLHDPADLAYSLMENKDVDEIRKKLSIMTELEKDDVVKVLEGPMRGNYGYVRGCYLEEAAVSINVGTETIEASISITHLRRSNHRTKARKLKKRQRKNLRKIKPDQDKIPVFGTESGTFKVRETEKQTEEVTPSGDGKITRIIRRGLKNTRVVRDGVSTLITNEELRDYTSGINSEREIPE
jgi:ribosomal protein L24